MQRSSAKHTMQFRPADFVMLLCRRRIVTGEVPRVVVLDAPKNGCANEGKDNDKVING